MTDVAELRRMRAAVARSKSYQRLAAGGILVAAGCCYYANAGVFRGTPMQQITRYAAVVIFLASLVPFFMLKCPKCCKRYKRVQDLFRSFNNPSPCVSCGFDMEKHVPRYGPPEVEAIEPSKDSEPGSSDSR